MVPGMCGTASPALPTGMRAALGPVHMPWTSAGVPRQGVGHFFFAFGSTGSGMSKPSCFSITYETQWVS
jgi:hypothetical protein